MHFELRHTFHCPVDQVLDAMFDPALADFYKANMKLVREIRPLDRVDEGDVVRRKVRYVPVPVISSVGPKKIPPEALAWVEESTCQRSARKIEFRNLAERDGVRKHLANSGTITFRDLEGGKSERVVAGDLVVGNLPFFLRPLGGLAEKIIYSNAEKILNEEAQVLGEFIRQRQATAK